MMIAPNSRDHKGGIKREEVKGEHEELEGGEGKC